jgi:hypothetical protein
MLLFPMPHVPPTTIGLNLFANTPFAIAHKVEKEKEVKPEKKLI